jgi:hypothetical protein
MNQERWRIIRIKSDTARKGRTLSTVILLRLVVV